MASHKRERNLSKEKPSVQDEGDVITTGKFLKKRHAAGVRELDQNEGLRYFDKRRLKKHPHKAYVITMFFSNGTTRTWVIKSNSETFTYRKRMYHLRYENAQYDLTQGGYHLYYNEDFSSPIDREIRKQGNEAWFTVTPDNLAPLVKMELVKALVSSTELNKYLKMLVVIGGMTFIASLVAAAILLNNLRQTLG